MTACISDTEFSSFSMYLMPSGGFLTRSLIYISKYFEKCQNLISVCREEIDTIFLTSPIILDITDGAKFSVAILSRGR